MQKVGTQKQYQMNITTLLIRLVQQTGGTWTSRSQIMLPSSGMTSCEGGHTLLHPWDLVYFTAWIVPYVYHQINHENVGDLQGKIVIFMGELLVSGRVCIICCLGWVSGVRHGRNTKKSRLPHALFLMREFRSNVWHSKDP